MTTVHTCIWTVVVSYINVLLGLNGAEELTHIGTTEHKVDLSNLLHPGKCLGTDFEFRTGRLFRVVVGGSSPVLT